MKNLKKLLVLAVSVLALVLFSLTASAEVYVTEENTAEWVQNQDGTWSFYLDGELVRGDDFCYNNKFYRVDPNGIMYEKEWVQPYLFDFTSTEEGRTRWYYYGQGGIAPSGKFDGYYFQYNGELRTDTWEYEYDDSGVERCIYLDANGHVGGTFVEGWNFFGGNWYYYESTEGVYRSNSLDYGSAKYFFDYRGKMLVNKALYSWIDGKEHVVYADKNGHLTTEGWFKDEGSWYYIKEDGSLAKGYFDIGEKTFLFDYDGALLCNYKGYYESYVITNSNGEVLKNAWYYDAAAAGGDYSGWIYCDEDSRRVYYGIYEIDGAKYYFYDGYAIADTVAIDDDGSIYYFGDDLKGNHFYGWVETAGGESYLSFGEYPYDGWFNNGTYWYYLDNGNMYYNTVERINEDYYAFAADGKLINEPDNHSVVSYDDYNRDYVLVGPNDGRLITGWYPVNGTYRYYAPYMLCNTYYEIDGVNYYFDENGYYTTITGEGFQFFDGCWHYFRGGKPVINDWVYSGAWYYFNVWGEMLVDRTRGIGDYRYYFDASGKMYTDGWLVCSGSWCYANEDGTLATDFAVIDDTIYNFDSDGFLCNGTEVAYVGENKYLFVDGVAVKDVTDTDGWVQVGSVWYYIDSDCSAGYYDDGEYKIGENYYYFDESGKMGSNLKRNSRFYGADGKRVEDGWGTDGVYWYYADNGWLRLYSIEINGKYYCFNDDYQLKIGTFDFEDWYGNHFIVVTDANGAVIAYSNVDIGGDWKYSSYEGGGNVFYIPAGRTYTGWLGDYYLWDGYLLTNQNIEQDGKRYYLQANGLCARNTWIQVNDNIWCYAKYDGSFYCDEWAYISGNWYYFNSWGDSFANASVEIDGVVYLFGADRELIGTVVINKVENGWTTDNYGNWYYFRGGAPVTGMVHFANASYVFDERGTMATNCFYGGRYFGADGKMIKYTGWQFIGGVWTYYDEEYLVVAGWKTIDGKTYYFESDENSEYGMVTGYKVIGGKLYYFNESGALEGARSIDNGWYDVDGKWYFFRNGTLAEAQELIDGVAYYAFNRECEMVTNDVYYGHYYGADGKRVMTTGWLYTSDGWRYIDSDGYVCTGIRLINGVEYCFDNDGVWVQ